eukprot:scaffold271647_cov36-Prasinocladus_malaysianus.AAC.1
MMSSRNAMDTERPTLSTSVKLLHRSSVCSHDHRGPRVSQAAAVIAHSAGDASSGQAQVTASFRR